MEQKLKFRLFNLLFPILVPLILAALLLSIDSSNPNVFHDWYLHTAYWLFGGPIPFLVSAFSTDWWRSTGFILRLLTIAPFVFYVPNQHEAAVSRMGLNAAITMFFAVLGFLWLILSGV
jgi:hypothetical protein